MTQLTKRLEALEAARAPSGPVIGFWAMNEDFQPMTEQAIEIGIAALMANSPAKARIVPMTC